MKTFSTLIHAALLGAVTVPLLLVPSFAQQEVDPTWHDPWAVTTPTPPNAARLVAPHKPTPKTASTEAALRHKKQVRKQEQPAIAQSAMQPILQETELAKK